MNKRDPGSELQEILEDNVRRLKVASHPVRVRILRELALGSRCVKDLNAIVPELPQPHLSQHMSALRRAGLVACHSDGPLRCYYVLRPSLVGPLLEILTRPHDAVERERSAVRAEARGDGGCCG